MTKKLTPAQIANTIIVRGPDHYKMVVQALALAPGKLSMTKLDQFIKAPDKGILDADQIAFLEDCVRGRYAKCNQTGKIIDVRPVAAAAVSLGVRAPQYPRSEAVYEVGQGALGGKITAQAKPQLGDDAARIEAAKAKREAETPPTKKKGWNPLGAIPLPTFGSARA